MASQDPDARPNKRMRQRWLVPEKKNEFFFVLFFFFFFFSSSLWEQNRVQKRSVGALETSTIGKWADRFKSKLARGICMISVRDKVSTAELHQERPGGLVRLRRGGLVPSKNEAMRSGSSVGARDAKLWLVASNSRDTVLDTNSS